MSTYSFVLPFAQDENGSNVILGQRALLQTKFDGKENRTPSPLSDVIPEWAGQWGLIGGVIADSESAEAAAVRHFKAQTGLDLSDPDIQSNFLLGNQGMMTEKTEDYAPLNVLTVFTTMGGLKLLNSVLDDTIGTIQVSDGTLEKAAIYPIKDARSALGAAAAPSSGWRDYLVQQYYGGKPPGQLNTEIDVLTKTLTERAAQDNSLFTTALNESS